MAAPNAAASGNRLAGIGGQRPNPSSFSNGSGRSGRSCAPTADPRSHLVQPATSSVIAQPAPVSSSNSTAPSEKTSVRRSSSACLACSGDMYARLPFRLPTTERSLRRFASPKSESFTSPANEMSMFDGVTSR